MLKYFLKTATRALTKDKRSTILNLVGLSTGLASAILIFMWVSDELQTNKFFKNDSRLFEVMENRVQASGIWTAPSSSGLMAGAMARDFPEIEYSTNTVPAQRTPIKGNKDLSLRAEGEYAGQDFFHVFSYELIRGNAGKVLADKNSIVLSEELAMKIFGSTDVIGKAVSVGDNRPYMVSGIFKKPVAHASEIFDFIIPIAFFADSNKYFNEWGTTFPKTFVLLRSNADAAAVNRRLAGYIKQKTSGEITYRTPFITRYSTLYLHGRYENGKVAGGQIEFVRLFSIVGIIILLIACINFMNLSTAKAAIRSKEVGLKKTMGAGRGTLILQFFAESVIMSFAALFMACVLVSAFLPVFNSITRKELNFWHPDVYVVAAVLITTVLTGALAGVYPALYLSGFKPVIVLKGAFKNSGKQLFIRKSLVVFQTVLSVVFIVGVLVVYKQIYYIQTRDLGYKHDHVIIFQKEGKLAEGKTDAAFLDEVRRIPGVSEASSIGHNLAGHNNGTNGVEWKGKDLSDKTEFEGVAVDYGALQTLGISLKEGRDFSKSYGADSSAIIFNEAAIKYMGLKNPIGQTVKLWDENVHIIGVVRDFNFQSLHEPIKPLLMWLSPSNAYKFILKIQTDRERVAIEKVASIYRQYNPEFPFDYDFLDANFQRMYVSENVTSVLSRYFAGIAILISCLGLFGLAAFTVDKREREIGVRKVVGASTWKITSMLLREFLMLVIIALIIAVPAGWWLTHQWLAAFVYRVTIGWNLFVFAGLASVALAAITVSFQTISAARANPVKVLKRE